MGLGLNITEGANYLLDVALLSERRLTLANFASEANYVIIFDVDWNPSWDAQAQDRAYRLGQQRDVTVFRLLSQGTIEEMKYLRQLYKKQLKGAIFREESEENKESAELERFRGVDGVKDEKGELFG
jgi:hypothetical protein